MKIVKTKVIAVSDPCPIHPSPFKRRHITNSRAVEVVMTPYYRERIKDGSLKYYKEPDLRDVPIVKVIEKTKVNREKSLVEEVTPPIRKPEKKKVNIPKPVKRKKTRFSAGTLKTGRK